MEGKSYFCTPRDVLFFRDGRPMDIDKSKQSNVRNIGHGAEWPRPDHLFSAVMHHLIQDPTAPEGVWYGSVPNLKVVGPYPYKDETHALYLPLPLDWQMEIAALPEGQSNLPKPLTHGFCDKTPGKKHLPRWVSLEVYQRYLKGEESAPLLADNLYVREARVGTTLDPATGASQRVQDRYQSGQYHAEYLRLQPGVRMICAIDQQKKATLSGDSIIMGGQGGTVLLEDGSIDLLATLEALPKGKATRYVRWTLISPALFDAGWYPNWLDEDGRVMIPQNEVLRRPGEKREAFRKRKQAECQCFESAHLIAARIGPAEHFSGWDSEDGIKETQLLVPAGSSYVFECKDEQEAANLVKALSLRPLSDLGPKGLGIGLCSYVKMS